ncbi:MAG TPA: delta-60 repeat domain-containing protein [Pyrinomonadaceae bacterium]|nr:delta-60 repeat domain-containing protein [Pyrinomonadaceae bacterium]
MRIQGDGRILLGGDFTHVNGWARNRIARLFANGKIDAGPIDLGFNPAPNQAVDTLALQGDGRILVTGRFGIIGGWSQPRIARLTSSGVAETSFTPSVGSHIAATPQSDGRVLIYGNSGLWVDGYSKVGIARLLPNGRLDSSFDVATDGGVKAVVSQADGSTLIGGPFTQVGGRRHTALARLNPDGTVDHTFNPSLIFTTSTGNAQVWAIATQEDGKILIGGWFDEVNGESRINFARVHPDGTLDREFNPSIQGNIHSIAVQADGRVIVGGQIYRLGGLADRSNLGRFNADGTLDAEFNPRVASGVDFIALQADGRAVIGGPFYRVGDQVRFYLAKLNVDGTLDGSFDAKLGPYYSAHDGGNPYTGVLQADGRLLIGGMGFRTPPSSDVTYFARVFNTGPATEDLSLEPTGSSVTWRRGGTGPEVSSVTFDVSADGVNFTPLGRATRVEGGWRLDGLGLGQGRRFYIRARGLFASSHGGRFGSKTSSSFVESVRVVEATN